MDDRELLELAAKAAGITGEWTLDKSFVQERWYFNVPYDNHGLLTGFEWNPLTDDGDCARMCAELEIDTYWYRLTDEVRCSADSDVDSISWAETTREHPDKSSAWRLAAVRCAAEIQKAREPK